MFVWNDDVIRFRIDAAEYGHFDDKIAMHIAKTLPARASVCDAGCGLGYLGLALARLGHHVTSVDTSESALNVLKYHIAAEGIDSLTVVQDDLFTMHPDPRYDAMVFCFFGGVDETLRAIKTQCTGKAYLIKKNWDTHRFQLRQRPLEKFTYLQTCARLDELHIPYQAETFVVEMGQPIRSLADAMLFFCTFDDDARTKLATEKDVAALLTKTDSGVFPYYLPSSRPLGILTINAGDIPDRI